MLCSAPCLTWPQLQQVVQSLNVPFEVHSVRYLFTIRGVLPSSSYSPGLLRGREEHRAEAHSQVLMGHPVRGAEGGHQTEVVQQEREGGL